MIFSRELNLFERCQIVENVTLHWSQSLSLESWSSWSLILWATGPTGGTRACLTFKFIQVFSWFHTSRADRFEMRSEVLALNFDWFLFLEREKKSWIFAEWQHGNFFWAPISHSSQCPTSEWFVHFLVSQKIESWRKWHLLTFSFDEKSRKFGGRRAWAQLPWAHHRTTSWTFPKSNKVKRMNLSSCSVHRSVAMATRTGEPLICVPRPAHSDGRLLHRL